MFRMMVRLAGRLVAALAAAAGRVADAGVAALVRQPAGVAAPDAGAHRAGVPQRQAQAVGRRVGRMAFPPERRLRL